MKSYDSIIKFLKDNNIELGKVYTYKDRPAFKAPQTNDNSTDVEK